VDLAAFQVKEVDSGSSTFMMTRVGFTSGYACGSTFVDRSFDKLLKEKLRPEDTAKLEDIGGFGQGGHFVRKPDSVTIHKRFLDIKHDFTGESTKLSVEINLPTGIELQETQEGESTKQLLLSADDLRRIFEPSIKKIKSLIGRQIETLEMQQLRVKSLFLSGGYAKSPYLFSEISAFANMWDINVERGINCWAAVPQGAVMKGLGLLTEAPPPVASCPRHYGVKTRRLYGWNNNLDEITVGPEGTPWAAEQIKWIFHQGDVIWPDREISDVYPCHWSMTARDYEDRRRRQGDPALANAASGELRDIVVVASDAERAPMRFAEIATTRDTVLRLKCDLMKVPPSQYDVVEEPSMEKYVKFHVKVELFLGTEAVRVEVRSGDVELAKGQLYHPYR